MYSPRLSKAATTFRSESSSTGNTTCLQSDKVSKTGADFMGHTRTLSLKHGHALLVSRSDRLGTNPSCWVPHLLFTTCDAEKRLTCLWGGTAVSRWGRGSGTAGRSLQLERPTAKQCCLWKRSRACGHLDSSYKSTALSINNQVGIVPS